MPLTKADADRAEEILKGARRIHCICHRNPDGDAVGAMLGCGLLLEERLPDAEIQFHCVDPVPAMFHFLPGSHRVSLPPLPEAFVPAEDVCVFVDSAEPKLTELHMTHPQLFEGAIRSVVVDHHPGNPEYGTVNFVVPDASSSCEVLVQLAAILGWPLRPDVATCLLTGVYTDTGGLLHSNTTSQVYRIVAGLLRAGARGQEVVQAVFRTASLSTLRLWGRVLEKISLTEEGGAISAVTEGDFRATGAEYSALTGAIDYVNAVPGMKFSLILSERGGKVKGSLRTLREDVDVAKMAGKFHGGGHRKAAGFALPGTLQPEVRWKVVQGGEEREERQEGEEGK